MLLSITATLMDIHNSNLQLFQVKHKITRGKKEKKNTLTFPKNPAAPTPILITALSRDWIADPACQAAAAL